MKFIINYEYVSGEDYYSRDIWSKDFEECFDYKYAVLYAVDLNTNKGNRFTGIIPIPEHPNEFIQNECGEFVVNFNEEKFLKEVDALIALKELAKKQKQEELKRIAAEQALEREKLKAENKEIAERAEFERLKAKFGTTP
jgi:hypothetical protein